jgi:hypothetical protein
MGKAVDNFDIMLNFINVGTTIYGDYLDRQASKYQREIALGMTGAAIVVSLCNTLWIIHTVKEQSKGANNNNGNLRALGSSGNNRDGSQHHRNNL